MSEPTSEPPVAETAPVVEPPPTPPEPPVEPEIKEAKETKQPVIKPVKGKLPGNLKEVGARDKKDKDFKFNKESKDEKKQGHAQILPEGQKPE